MGITPSPITSDLDAAQRLATLLYAMATADNDAVSATVNHSDACSPRTAYGDVERALVRVLTAVTGSPRRARQVRALLANGESVRYNLNLLARADI